MSKPKTFLTKAKKLHIDQIKSKAKIDGDIENVCCSAA